jgi:phosphatidylglycerol---prolipoprotein diacylglyceryl transferase
LKTRESWLWLLDRLAIPACMAGVFIRAGNFFNSEIVGLPASAPWAVVFKRIDSMPRHPAQLYEAFAYLAVWVILVMVYTQKNAAARNGLIFGLFLVLAFLSRILIEFVKTPQAAYGLGFFLNTGQILSIPFLLAGGVFLIKDTR